MRAGIMKWVAMGVVASACGGEATVTPVEAHAAQLQFATVSQTAWTPTEEITGSLEPLQSVQLSFDVPGRIAKVLVKRGDSVHAGDVLAELEDSIARAQLQQAAAASDAASSQLEAAESSWKRIQALRDAGGMSDQQFSDAQAAVAGARAQATQATAAVALARANLNHHSLRAPFSGVVTQAPDNAGAMVSTMGGAPPLFALEDLTGLQLKATASESSTWLEPGLTASVVSATSASSADAVTATVTRVLPTLDPATRRIPIEIRVDGAPTTLRAHGFARVRIQSAKPIQVFELPKAAVVARPDFSVFVQGKDVLERVPVTVLGPDPAKPDFVVVQGGLTEGQSVVVDPPSSLGGS